MLRRELPKAEQLKRFGRLLLVQADPPEAIQRVDQQRQRVSPPGQDEALGEVPARHVVIVEIVRHPADEVG
ncbi:hypothetical protein [Micromonospora sp. NPDC001898]|uniref:hypothetical protein n=1 Tax=Micromonospora sp. NPDC001898 TaxID=3364221 RepID=UPI0036A29CB8